MKDWWDRLFRQDNDAATVQRLRDELAIRGDEYEALYRRNAQLEAANEGLGIRRREATKARLAGLLQMERARAILTDTNLAADDRNARALRVLMEGEEANG